MDLSTPNSQNQPNKITNYFKPIDRNDDFNQASIAEMPVKDNDNPISQNANNNIPQVVNNLMYISIPYLNRTSIKIKNLLKTLLPENYSICLKPINKAKNVVYTNPKCKTEKLSKTNIIYKIPCLDCELSYIGQTKQYLSDRIKQHASNCKSKTEAQNKKTALSSHSTENNHRFNFDDCSIMHTKENWFKRGIIESIYILKNINEVVNFRSDAENVSHYYNNVIQNL